MLEPSLQTLEGDILMSPTDARNALRGGPLFQFPNSPQFCAFRSSVMQANLSPSELPAPVSVPGHEAPPVTVDRGWRAT